MTTTLSKFYPEQTQLFYGYPAGQDSGFFNLVPPFIEELVSGRPMVCLDQPGSMQVLAFASVARTETLKFLKDIGVPVVPEQNLIVFPNNITTEIVGDARNKIIKEALLNLIEPGRLIMAQPYTDQRLKDLFQINTDITTFLNDKTNLPRFIPKQYLPQRFREYENGQDFAVDQTIDLKFPVVIKVTASSSGDGVRICKTPIDFQKIQTEFATVQGNIFIEEYIDAVTNVGIQFGIPADPNQSLEIIGIAKQMTGKSGEFMGGQVEPWGIDNIPPQLKKVLMKNILPQVRALGWYGVGNLDVLFKSNDQFFFTDPNFRLTALTSFIFQTRNKILGERAMAPFSGVFRGDPAKFRAQLEKIAVVGDRNQILNIVALTEEEGRCNMNAAVVYDRVTETRKENARRLIEMGIQSETLKSLIENDI